MHFTVSTWSELRDAWHGVHNFRMAGECVPFSFDLPPLADVIDIIRRDPEARILRGGKGDRLDMESIADEFRALPLEDAVHSQFQLSHFNLPRFYEPGQFLHGFEEQVMGPWRQALTAAGFTWTRCYPIIFISGAGCASNYHMDGSHVVAWQRYGTKNFCGLKDPDRWAPREIRMQYGPGIVRPDTITPDDALAYLMQPGDVLWNQLLTPHWVEASDEPAMSINLSHGGLRLDGELCRNERELEAWRAQQNVPDPLDNKKESRAA
jgi:hypothetical protein